MVRTFTPPILASRKIVKKTLEEEEKERKLKEKEEEKWEELRKKTEEEKPLKAPEPPIIPQAEIITDQETGEITGIKLPSGDVFMGKERDIKAIAEKQPLQPQEASQVAFQRQQQEFMQARQQQSLELIRQIQGFPSIIGKQQPTPINIGAALTSGGVTAGLGIGAGLAAGAVSGGFGALLAGGAVFKGISDIRSEIGQQISDSISSGKAQMKTLRDLQMKLINQINSGIDDPSFSIIEFYKLRDEIRRLYGEAYANQKQWLAKATGKDASKALADFETYETKTFPFLEDELNLAILNPNPNRMKLTEPIELEAESI